MSAVLQARVHDLEWLPVNSTNVAAVAYDRDFGRLYVQFLSTKQCTVYSEVPEAVYKQLLAAESKGAFVYDEIRGAKGKRADRARGIPAPALDYLYPYDNIGRVTIPTQKVDTAG